jgi:hypothetical protein
MDFFIHCSVTIAEPSAFLTNIGQQLRETGEISIPDFTHLYLNL